MSKNKIIVNWSGVERIDGQEGFELSLEKIIGLNRRELDYQQIRHHKRRRGDGKICS